MSGYELEDLGSIPGGSIENMIDVKIKWNSIDAIHYRITLILKRLITTQQTRLGMSRKPILKATT